MDQVENFRVKTSRGNHHGSSNGFGDMDGEAAFLNLPNVMAGTGGKLPEHLTPVIRKIKQYINFLVASMSKRYRSDEKELRTPAVKEFVRKTQEKILSAIKVIRPRATVNQKKECDWMQQSTTQVSTN